MSSRIDSALKLRHSPIRMADGVINTHGPCMYSKAVYFYTVWRQLWLGLITTSCAKISHLKWVANAELQSCDEFTFVLYLWVLSVYLLIHLKFESPRLTGSNNASNIFYSRAKMRHDEPKEVVMIAIKCRASRISVEILAKVSWISLFAQHNTGTFHKTPSG